MSVLRPYLPTPVTLCLSPVPPGTLKDRLLSNPPRCGLKTYDSGGGTVRVWTWGRGLFGRPGPTPP